ncbi:MAG: hypothetical protein K2K20_05475 [Lachnospiraceae bacterium]|nr:hypothetical protein [Lachnospiraceae bacterium]
MRFPRLFHMLLKQYLRKPECLLLLLSLPVLTILFSHVAKTEDQPIQAACYLPSVTQEDLDDAAADSGAALQTDTALTSLAHKLSTYDGLYTFRLCASEQEVYDTVATGHAECGYIFSETLYEELLSGNLKGLITTVASPSTTMLPIINETVYSFVFEDLALLSLEQYLADDSAVSAEYDVLYDNDMIEELYQKYMLGDSTFHFEYEGSPEDYRLTAATVLLSPIRGLLSVLMLLSALTGAISYYRLSENQVFDTWKVRAGCIIIPVLCTAPVMLLCIYFAGLGTGLGKEICLLILYAAACVIATTLMTLFIKKRVIFTSLLPLFILACLVFTPVFIDISVFLPALKPLSYLFLPYYYLKFF